jgi:gamma-glutamylcyclotransferase (GGCT)/AIG2-like uncharacterized protein YtfP
MTRSPTALEPLDQDGSADGLGLPVFVYGSLLDTDFLARLLEHEVEAEPARLDGFRVVTLERFDWPVLVPDDTGSSVAGHLFRGLGREDLRRLDLYEGTAEDLYQRVGVNVVPEASGVAETAWTYLPTDRTLQRLG